MFIDEVRKFNFKMFDNSIRDATVFRIYESISNYWIGFKNCGSKFLPEEDEYCSKVICGSFMPYDNICLAFNDRVLWILENGIPDDTDARLIVYYMFHRISKTEMYENSPVIESRPYSSLHKYANGFYLKFGGICTKKGMLRPAKSEYEEGCLVQNGVIIASFLNLLSCKNVRIIKNSVGMKVQRKRKKKNKPPLVSYYILELQSLSGKTSPSAGGLLWSNRVHFCRGHVREYGPPGLFGKYIGRFWIPPHIKGKNSEGKIHKDYALSKIMSDHKLLIQQQFTGQASNETKA